MTSSPTRGYSSRHQSWWLSPEHLVPHRAQVVACEPEAVARIGKGTTIFCERRGGIGNAGGLF